MLLEADADINKLTKNGSALHEAALYGKTAVVKLLMDVSLQTTETEFLSAGECIVFHVPDFKVLFQKHSYKKQLLTKQHPFDVSSDSH